MTQAAPELHYKVSGPDGPDVECLVVLHGLFGSLENLGGISRPLSAQYRIIAVDLPNHGRSPWVEAHSMSLSAMAASIVAVLDKENIASAHILGHSLGGKVAMELALAFPRRVKRLLIADIAPVAYGRRHDSVFAALNSLDLASFGSRKEAELALRDGPRKIVEADVRLFLLKNLYKTSSGEYGWRMNLAVLEQAYPEFIGAPRDAEFKGPVLFLKGEESDYILPAHRDEVLRRFPHSQLKSLQGCGHWLHAQKPEVFIRLCEKFLAS